MSTSSTEWTIGRIPSSALTWGAQVCRTCNTRLLSGEKAGFCCGPHGNRFEAVPPLPPLPIEYEIFLHDTHVSALSRKLNLIFSFASLESSHAFPSTGHPSFLTIAGKIYHRIRSGHNDESAIRWMLYDGFEASSTPHQSQAEQLPALWIYALQTTLLRINPLASQLYFMHTLQAEHRYPTASLILQDSGCREIAAVMRYENTIQSEISPRSLIISRKTERHQRIATVSRLWEPLVYPLLFPAGTLGWGLHSTAGTSNEHDVHDTTKTTTQMWFYRGRLLREERFAIFGRLTNEYVVDMFTRDLECRLHYIRANQMRLRAEEEDAALMAIEDVSDAENIYLPASFLGSTRWSSNQIADSLAIAAQHGSPTFFITFTCNSDWIEIKSQLRPGQNYTDIPVVVCRVFKQKLSKFLRALRTMFPHIGPPVYIIHRVEFQKRGLPHAHILVKYPKDCLHPHDIDAVISAHIPDDEHDAALVRKYMLHAEHPSSIINHQPPSLSNPLRYCERWRDGARICRFGYPKPLRITTEVNEEGRVLCKRLKDGDERVVAHCIDVLREFKCHINWENGGSGQLFQYLFKYIHKGSLNVSLFTTSYLPAIYCKGGDYGRFRLRMNDDDGPIDEIEEYWNARYLSSTEATWRILGFHITQKIPAVTCLAVHVENSIHHSRYHTRANIHSQSKLLHYFARPQGSFIINQSQRSFDSLLYVEYFSFFRLQPYEAMNDVRNNFFKERYTIQNSPCMHVVQRLPRTHHIARLQSVHLSVGELFYIRALLQNRPATSFTDLRTINNITYPTFQEAAIALGIFAHESEAEYSFLEAIHNLRTPRELRFLFIHLLTNDCIHTPINIWNKFHINLSQDFILGNQNNVGLGINLALNELGTNLEEYGKTLSDYGLPQPTTITHELIHEINRWSSQSQTLLQRSISAAALFNAEQTSISNRIIQAMTNNEPLMMFIDGKAGRGKTFLVNTLCDWVRGQGHVVLPTATSAFAAQLYAGGRTTHSTFKVPVNENDEMLSSHIKENDSRAELIRAAKLIIWDEAPMAKRAVLACVDEVCRKVMNNNLPFGGKIIILLGDFRQTCPVVQRSTRAQVIAASIRSSPLWPLFQIQHLITPIRNATDPEFADFVDDIGDGRLSNVEFPIINTVHSKDEIINFVFPNDVLCDETQCVQHAILTPTNAQADDYNDTMLTRLSGQHKTYFAADRLEEREDAMEAIRAENNETLPTPDALLDYVARRRPKGMPHHRLNVKVGGIYRLLRNFSIDRGLVKNVRVVVTGLGERLISVRILKSTTSGMIRDEEEFLIPRINFNDSLTSGHTLLRRQFPLAPAYATTFHSCQGLTLRKVAIDLTTPVFTHGQLYTALSRVRRRQDLCIFLTGTSTSNVTYTELLL